MTITVHGPYGTRTVPYNAGSGELRDAIDFCHRPPAPLIVGQVLAARATDDHDAPMTLLGRVTSVVATENGFTITTQARDDDTFGYTVGDPS
ncbi:hypothetical protein ACLQ3K_25710 [Tsukamurella sp. DT100]|uniref:hypothetical protein n=1 Tax=Tsukamurella sp. DT100 TaxID=3393415 RepID=UPI003CEFA26D